MNKNINKLAIENRLESGRFLCSFLFLIFLNGAW